MDEPSDRQAAERERRRSEVMARRREILTAFERERGRKAITLIHRHEPWDDDQQYIAGFGLHVTEGVPALVYDMFSTCEFGVCKRPCLANYDHAGVGHAEVPFASIRGRGVPIETR